MADILSFSGIDEKEILNYIKGAKRILVLVDDGKGTTDARRFGQGDFRNLVFESEVVKQKFIQRLIEIEAEETY